MTLLSDEVQEQSPQVLIIDDDGDFRTLLRHYLERADFRVAELADGSATHGVASSNYDLIVIDMVMPNVEGLETIAKMRSSGFRDRILAISGADRSSVYLQLAKHLGADAICEKLVLLQDPLGVIGSLIRPESSVPESSNKLKGDEVRRSPGNGRVRGVPSLS